MHGSCIPVAHTFTRDTHVHYALPRPSWDNDSDHHPENHAATPSPPAGVLSHLDAVYGFALTLTGDAESAAQLTEQAFECIHDNLWSTLGGQIGRAHV